MKPRRPPPPGWHADPGGARMRRWWDGSQWTLHTQPLRPARVPAAPPGQIGAIGLLASGVGLVLVIVAYTTVSWIELRDPEADTKVRFDFGRLGGDTTVNGWASIFFSGIGWLLFGLLALLCVGACIESSARSACIAAGTAVGVLGFLATLFAMGDLSRQAKVSLRDLIPHFGPGPWLASAGFVICGFAALFGRATPGR